MGMLGMTFDPTITSGALMNALVLLIGFAIAFTKIGGRIDLLTQRLTAVEDALKAARDINERIAVIETRQGTHGQMIATCQVNIEELRHGRGFIQGRASSGIDGAY